MDEKGYVMSGVGFLLLIPVMIIIPVALSLEDQSSYLPETFVKSDTLFQTYKNVYADINSKVNEFTGDPKKNNGIGTYGVVYRYNDSNQLAGKINYLYSRTEEQYYKDAFNGTVDSMSIGHAFSDTLTTSNTIGTIPLINGIKISYQYVNKTNDKQGNILYTYAMNVTVNMTINIKKDNSGLNQNFVMVYPISNAFQVNSTTTNNATAETNVAIFFNGLNSAFFDKGYILK